MATELFDWRTQRRQRTWVRPTLAVGMALMLLATVLSVALQRKLILIGSLSTLGLPAFVYLAALWCVAASLLGRLIGRDAAPASPARTVTAFATVVLLAVATNLLGTGGHDAAATPLVRLDPGGGQPDYVVRVGSAIDPSDLTLYRGRGKQFDLVSGVSFSPPDVRQFEAQVRLATDDGGATVLVYPGRDGRASRIVLPKQ